MSAVLEQRFTLARAVDHLVDAARQAKTPGWVWIAGLLYPSLNLGLGSGWELQLWSFFGDRPPDEIVGYALSWSALMIPFVLLFYRLSLGLARISPAQAWEEARGERRTPRLGTVWDAGRGLTWAAFGLWFQLYLMHLAAIVVVGLPVYFLRNWVDDGGNLVGIFTVTLVLLPLFVVSVLYLLILSTMMQLGLHSLIQNRRGVSSALQHAWRLIRNDPGAAARAILVDALLWVTIHVLVLVITVAMGLVCLGWLFFVPMLALSGYMGMTRAGYWARVYRALGGLSPLDGVPGLGDSR